MKKILISVILLLSILLCSCWITEQGGNIPNEHEDKTDGVDISTEISSGEATDGEDITESYISGEEIDALMQKYLTHEMYTVYDSLGVDSSLPDESGMYFKVSDEKYDTWDEWIAFYESIYAGVALEEQLNILEAEKAIINIDGYTYCTPRGMGWILSDGYSYDIVRSSQTRAMVEISRTEHSFGESAPAERIWYFLFGLTDDGWRILDIVSF